MELYHQHLRSVVALVASDTDQKCSHIGELLDRAWMTWHVRRLPGHVEFIAPTYATQNDKEFMIIACAGGIRAELSIDLSREAVNGDYRCYTIAALITCVEHGLAFIPRVTGVATVWAQSLYLHTTLKCDMPFPLWRQQQQSLSEIYSLESRTPLRDQGDTARILDTTFAAVDEPELGIAHMPREIAIAGLVNIINSYRMCWYAPAYVRKILQRGYVYELSAVVDDRRIAFAVPFSQYRKATMVALATLALRNGLYVDYSEFERSPDLASDTETIAGVKKWYDDNLEDRPKRRRRLLI